jgi:hypothetical protein
LTKEGKSLDMGEGSFPHKVRREFLKREKEMNFQKVIGGVFLGVTLYGPIYGMDEPGSTPSIEGAAPSLTRVWAGYVGEIMTAWGGINLCLDGLEKADKALHKNMDFFPKKFTRFCVQN